MILGGKMNIIGIIPARMASTRFPGKPLKEILGNPMIYHVYWRSKMSKVLNDVYLATCDKEIETYCNKNNIKVIMTKDTHTRASDRAAEAMVKIEELTGKRIDIPIMIQGDEPMLHPEMIDEVTKPILKDQDVNVVNLMAEIASQSESEDYNVIKVVVDLAGFALYFSREQIPFCRDDKPKKAAYKQIAIIPFRRDFLTKFNELPATTLEIKESVDMLRFLEHGYKVKMVKTAHPTYSVDTIQDLHKVEEIMRKDELTKKY